MSLIQSHPYLRDILLAIAAAHLRHHVRNPKQPRLAEHFHSSIALRGFNAQLGRPMAGMTPSDVDTLLLAGIMVNMMTFMLPSDEDGEPCVRDPDPALSWVFSPCSHRLDWLAVQMGFKSLRRLADGTGHAPGLGVLREFFTGLAQDSGFISANVAQSRRFPSSWEYVFDIDADDPGPRVTVGGGSPDGMSPASPGGESGTTMNNYLYREPLQAIAEIRQLEPTMANVFRYLHFAGVIGQPFRKKLLERDDRALWVFGMWLGCMGRYRGIWWLSRRVLRDLGATRMWLHQRRVAERPGLQGLAWADLLRDLDDSVRWRPPI
jgi:hypothetical protein